MSVIEVKGLSKSFGQNEIIKNMELTVEKGEVIVILGESGCGKSLFLRMLEQLEKPDCGSIRLLGEDITIALEYSEAQKTINLICNSKSNRYDLFADNDTSDHLGVAIIKSRAESYSFSYENSMNTVLASIRRSCKQTDK